MALNPRAFEVLGSAPAPTAHEVALCRELEWRFFEKVKVFEARNAIEVEIPPRTAVKRAFAIPPPTPEQLQELYAEASALYAEADTTKEGQARLRKIFEYRLNTALTYPKKYRLVVVLTSPDDKPSFLTFFSDEPAVPNPNAEGKWVFPPDTQPMVDSELSRFAPLFQRPAGPPEHVAPAND